MHDMLLTKFLEFAQSTDPYVRTKAQDSLTNFQFLDPPGFLVSLSQVLYNDDNPAVKSRTLAGIMLKNSLDAKPKPTPTPTATPKPKPKPKRKRKRATTIQHSSSSNTWISNDVVLRSQIKETLLNTLGSSVSEVRRTAAQVIATIASIEIPSKQWPTLIASLLQMMTITPASKLAALEALGYVCERISHTHLVQAEVDNVITALLDGMSLTAPSCVRLAATKALYHASRFAFRSERHKPRVMTAVCQTAKAKEADIKQVSFDCLNSFAAYSFRHLEPYMMPSLRDVTESAVKGDEQVVVVQAIEFWSIISQIEGLLNKGTFHFIQNALHWLVPILLETSFKLDVDHGKKDDTCHLADALENCLVIVSITVGDAFLPFVRSFVLENISKADWRSRAAAIDACGSYLDGLTAEQVVKLVHSDVPCLIILIINAMEDQNRHVKDTAASTLSCILDVCLNHFKIAPPHVAEKICEVIGHLAQGCSSVLAPLLLDIIGSLIATAERTDAKLSRAAYGTLEEVVRHSNVVESSETIKTLFYEIVSKLRRAIEFKLPSKQEELHALICGVMPVVIQKLSSTDQTKNIIIRDGGRTMKVLLQVLDSKSSIVREKAMSAVGAFAYAIGPKFCDYMRSFSLLLIDAIYNFKESKVCSESVRVVGDICRALDYMVLRFSKDIIQGLCYICREGVDRSVKPHIFSRFGDIALAIDIHFEDYVPSVVPLLIDAANECAQNPDWGYGNQLKQSIFVAYSGILQGCKRSKAEIMKPLVPHLFKFVQSAVEDPNRDENVAVAAVAVLGDLADALALSPPNVKMFMEHLPLLSDFLGQCALCEGERLKNTATRTLKMIDKISSTHRTQDEDQDKKDDAVFPFAKPFLLKNTSKPYWLSCAAATSSYECRSVKHLSNFGLECPPNTTGDTNRLSAAWTLDCILKFINTPATGLPLNFPKHQEIIHFLLDSPEVTVRVCEVIYHLAQETSSSVLAPYLKDIITSLIAAAERTDASYAKLRSAAYETLQEVIRRSNIESIQEITRCLTVFINKLEQTIKLPILSSEDSEKQGDLLALICGVVQVIIQKLNCTNETKDVISKAADQIMKLLFQVFICKRPAVYENAMLAIGALACATGKQFEQYMKEFCDCFDTGLENFKEYKTDFVSIGVVSDICRALDYKVVRFLDGIYPPLARKLYSEDLHWSVKSQMFSCFGDMALAAGVHFERKVAFLVPAMEEAAKKCAQIDEEMVEYGNQLKVCIFKAYSGILQGCKRSKYPYLVLVDYVPCLFKFIKVVVKDANRDKSVVGAAVVVLGDIADALALGPHVKVFKDHLPFCSEFLGECLQSECEQLKEIATRTQEMIEKISSICG